jgi:hypothetical protein
MTTNLILGILCIVAGALIILFGLLQARKASTAKARWAEAHGQILESHLQSQRSRSSSGISSTTYSPEVTYEYEVDGQTYTGNRLGFGSGSFSEKKAKAKIAPYPAGAAVTVHYDPAEPSNAVLETVATNKGGALVLGGALIALGVITMLVL